MTTATQSTVGERKQATSLTAINKLIGSISKAANKLNDEIHNCAVLCFEHAREYGDTSPAARLVDAMPKSFRRALLINWFATYSPVTIALNSKTDQMKAHLAGKAEERQWDIEAAKATPFFALPEAEREPDVPTYEAIHTNIIQFIERMEKKAKGDERRKGIEDEAERNKALAELGALKNAVLAEAVAA